MERKNKGNNKFMVGVGGGGDGWTGRGQHSGRLVRRNG